MNNKYIDINIEDLITDQNFIEWVLSNKQDLEWIDFMQSNPSQIEKINKAKSFVLKLNESKSIINNNKKELIWSKINERTKSNIQIKYYQKHLILAAAACIAFFLIVIPLINKDRQALIEVVNNLQGGNKKEVVLPDNSFVYLDENASLLYDKDEFLKIRKLNLKGQAFFEVEKGNSFLVHTVNGSVEVLGTSFNVIEKSDNLIVSCFTGKVEVRFKDKKVTLLPGEESNFNIKENKQIFDPSSREPLWMNNQMTFNNTDLKDVIKQVQEAYNIKIELDARLLDKKYTGIIVRNDINKALTALFWPLHMKYSLEGNKVTVTSDK
jgi:ferric-dicitrate binding protein FerR (iron transport regulator)